MVLPALTPVLFHRKNNVNSRGFFIGNFRHSTLCRRLALPFWLLAIRAKKAQVPTSAAMSVGRSTRGE